MFSWHAIPFARILVPFIFGILAALFFPLGIAGPAVAVIITLAVFLFLNFKNGLAFNFRFRLLTGISISFLIILLGYFRTYWFNDLRQPDYFTTVHHAKYLKVSIDDAVIQKTKFYRCYASVKGVMDSSGNTFETHGTLLLYLRKGNNVRKPLIGDQYLLKANFVNIDEPSNPEEFNYKRYLGYKNIFYQEFSDSTATTRLAQPQYSIYRKAIQLRDYSLMILNRTINAPKELGVAEALLLGYKDDLDPDITDAFARTGTLHVLAVSGLHAGVIYLILAFLTKPLSRLKKGKVFQVVLILFGIWLYAFVTGLSSSVLRASVMFSFMAIGKLLKYHVNIYNNIFSSAFILLLYNPFFLMDVGFQLSYIAVLGIVFIQPKIAKWYLPKNWLIKHLWGLITVSLAAQILTFPISIFYFHQFPNYFLLANCLIIPLTSLILIGLILLLAIHFIPIAGIILGSIIVQLLKLNNWLVQTIDDMPYAYIGGLNFNLLQMLLVYAILLVFISFCIHRFRYLMWITMLLTFCYLVNAAFLRYNHINQRILVVHHIKGHDVFTCIDGLKVTLIADTNFIADKRSIRFFLDPYFCSHEIEKIETRNFNESFVTTNIKNVKNIGFQFYDRILTINQALPESDQKNGILYLKYFQKELFQKKQIFSNFVKMSPNISNTRKELLKKQYFKFFKIKLKEDKSFILISF